MLTTPTVPRLGGPHGCTPAGTGGSYKWRKIMRYHDDDAFDEHGMLKDGRSVRVRMTMMDVMQRDIAAQTARLTDGSGDGHLGLHRPGWRVTDAFTRDASHYTAYERDLTTAWQRDASSAFVSQRVPDKAATMLDERQAEEHLAAME
jgi:hypothetical protein